MYKDNLEQRCYRQCVNEYLHERLYFNAAIYMVAWYFAR
jgi:hypothetical protein